VGDRGKADFLTNERIDTRNIPKKIRVTNAVRNPDLKIQAIIADSIALLGVGFQGMECHIPPFSGVWVRDFIISGRWAGIAVTGTPAYSR
jgi:hypothetical protein